MAASWPSPSLASSLGLSLRPDWLEQASARQGGAAAAVLSPEHLMSLALNADFNCVGAGGALPADLEVRFRSSVQEASKRTLSCFEERKRGEKRGRAREEISDIDARFRFGCRVSRNEKNSSSFHTQQPLHGRALGGKRVLQVDEVVNAAASAKHR